MSSTPHFSGLSLNLPTSSELDPMFRTANSQFVHKEKTPMKKTLTVKENKSNSTLHPHFR